MPLSNHILRSTQQIRTWLLWILQQLYVEKYFTVATRFIIVERNLSSSRTRWQKKGSVPVASYCRRTYPDNILTGTNMGKHRWCLCGHHMGELVHVDSMMNWPRCPCGPHVGEINDWKCAKGPRGPLCQIFMEPILMKTHHAYTYPLCIPCEHMHSGIHTLPWLQSTTFDGTTYIAAYRTHPPITIAAKPFYFRINLGEDPVITLLLALYSRPLSWKRAPSITN